MQTFGYQNRFIAIENFFFVVVVRNYPNENRSAQVSVTCRKIKIKFKHFDNYIIVLLIVFLCAEYEWGNLHFNSMSLHLRHCKIIFSSWKKSCRLGMLYQRIFYLSGLFWEKKIYKLGYAINIFHFCTLLEIIFKAFAIMRIAMRIIIILI